MSNEKKEGSGSLEGTKHKKKKYTYYDTHVRFCDYVNGELKATNTRIKKVKRLCVVTILVVAFATTIFAVAYFL